jgi:hypothetical protein
MAEMSPLRRRMIEDITVQNLSLATQRSSYGQSIGPTDAPSRRLSMIVALEPYAYSKLQKDEKS